MGLKKNSTNESYLGKQRCHKLKSKPSITYHSAFLPLFLPKVQSKDVFVSWKDFKAHFEEDKKLASKA